MRVKLLGTLSLTLLVVVGAMVMGAASLVFPFTSLVIPLVPSLVVMVVMRVVMAVVVSFSNFLTRGPYTKLSTSMRSQKRMA